MKILVTGATGLIGAALMTSLRTGGHTAVALVRRPPRPGLRRAEVPTAIVGTQADEANWDPATGAVDAGALAGADAVVHLVGETIAQRWTRPKKELIRRSRIDGTRLLCESLVRAVSSPRLLICASAIGIYGDRGVEWVTEDSQPGAGFLAEVCRDWETACAPARQKGIRVVNLRLGVVLSARGGALAKMLWPFRLGLGGVVGSGKQYWSWVALDDVIGAIGHALATERLAGPVNVVAPNPATNREFTRALGRVLGRPTIFPVPALAARLAFGEMADAVLLGGARVEPRRLTETGYSFRFPELEPALRHVLG